MAQPRTWADAAFLQVVADLFSLAVHVTAVNSLGEVSELGYLMPSSPDQTTAVIEIGCWPHHHFVAIADLLPNAAASPTDTRRVDDNMLTSIFEVRRLLSQPGRPSVLVGFEFSGALSRALTMEGFVVLSCDLRPLESKATHFHYQGDIRDVLPLQHWERVYFFPPCFQHLRADVECLPRKVQDGRAYWGCALVLWCLACPNADAVVVEQPDTIVNDGLRLPPSVDLVEFRTPMFGDDLDKFVRLALRNASLPPFVRQAATPISQSHRSQFQFASADERDRVRSSWGPHAHTCSALARLQLKQPTCTPLPYAELISLFALLWFNSGKPLPADYNAHDTQPTTPSLRDYQKQRGPGDGRRGLFVHHPPHLQPNRDFSSRLGGGTPEDVTKALDPSEESHAEPSSHGEASSDDLLSLRDPVPPGQCLAALICICVLVHPLVLVHANGFLW